MSTLLQSQIVMSFLWQVDDWAIFSYNDDEGEQPQFFRLKTEAWEDMGKPRTITITIEPGDKLNG